MIPTIMNAAQHDLGGADALRERIQGLVGERQALRSASAGRDELERNRQEICRLQRELSLALVAEFQPATA